MQQYMYNIYKFVIIITFPYFSLVPNVFGSRNKFDTETEKE